MQQQEEANAIQNQIQQMHGMEEEDDEDEDEEEGNEFQYNSLRNKQY